MTTGRGTAAIRFLLFSDTSGFDLTKVSKQLDVAKLKTQSLNAAFSMLQVGMAATIASAVGIMAPFMIASNAVGEMDRQLRLASSAAGDTRMYEDMIGVIRELSIEYGIAKSELAAGVYTMSRSGLDFKEVSDLIRPAIQLAMGNAMELSDALDVGIAMFNLFSFTGLEATTMLEMLDKATDSSMLSVQQIPAIIEQTGSAFAIAGIELEKYLATMAALSQTGVTMGARHGSLITQMLGRSQEIMDVMGLEFIKDGLIDWDMFMTGLTQIEKGSTQYQELLSVFGAGKGGKTFTDLIAAAEAYDFYVQEILAAGGYMEDKAAQMADSIPSLMARIREAMNAPFANKEVIDGINRALNSLLETFADPEYERALLGIITQSSNFIANDGPQLIGILTQLLQIYEAFFPVMINLLNIGMSVVSMMASVDAQAIAIGATLFILYKNLIPMMTQLPLLAQANAALARNLFLVNIAMFAVVGGFMLAISSGDKMGQVIGSLIVGVGALAAAVWGLNAAVAFGVSLSKPVIGAAAIVAGTAAAGATYAMASRYSAPTIPGGISATPSGAISIDDAKSLQIGTYIENQTVHAKGQDDVDKALAKSGGY